MGFLVTLLTYLVAFLAVTLAALYFFLKKKYNYWSERNIPHTTPRIPFGDLKFDRSISELSLQLYKENAQHKFFGFWFFHKPYLMVNDPELIKKILVQDFVHFPDHGSYVNKKDDPLSNHLFSMEGSKWKNLRAKMSPTFTSGKMKAMFPIMEEICKTMQKVVEPLAAQGADVEIKDLAGRYTTDVIASCAYGIETTSLENPDSIFRTMGKKIFEPTLESQLKNTIAFMAPDIARLVKLVQTNKEVSKFFLNVVEETIEYREKNDIQRNDFMSLLVQLKKKGIIEDVDDKTAPGDPFDLETAAAQAFIFFLGGFETTAGAIQFLLYELAKNPEIQDKLRQEILDELERSGGKMTYEGLFSLKYMGMVLEESQRKFPQAALLSREAAKDYKIPGTETIIEKGTLVFISPFGLHHDPRYFKNPDQFDPERFNDEEKAKRHHYVYLAFGEGPRFCIGQRFAQMQLRTAVFSLLSKFKFEMSEKTPKVIKLDPKVFVGTPEGGLHLKVTLL